MVMVMVRDFPAPTMHPLRRTAVAATLAAAASLLSVSVPACPAAAQARAAQERPAAPPDLRTTYLPSRNSPLVALRVIFRVGSQDDPPGKEGLAALTAAMVTRGGTVQLTFEQILERFYPMAAGLNGDCRKEVTVFSGEVHHDNLGRYVPIAAAMITTPRFAHDDFARLKNESLDFLTKTLGSEGDEELAKWALQLALYKNHPYGHADAGTAAGLRSITLDDVRKFHRAHYTREALALGVAGSVDEALLDEIRVYFTGSLPSRPLRTRPLPKPETPRGLDVTVVKKPAESTAISLGFPVDVTRRDDDFYALAVANSYLGEHRTFNGRLMHALRVRRGLNYGDYSYIEDFIQDGESTFPVPNNPRRQQAFSIWVRPVPHDKAVFALRAALRELDRLVAEGMSEADFEATRTFLLNNSKLWVQTPSRRLGYAMDGSFYDRADLVTEMTRRLPRLTVGQVNEAVRRHLKAPGVRVAVVTRDAESLAEALRSGAPSPITYDTGEPPASVLEEDKVITAYPLRGVSVKVVPVGALFEK